MTIIELYSRRKSEAERDAPDVYSYNIIPEKLRVQVRRILEAAVGPYLEYFPEFGTTSANNNNGWHFIRDRVAEEHGRLSLANEESAFQDCIGFLHGHSNTDEWLDLLEMALMYIDKIVRKKNSLALKSAGIKLLPDDAINEINTRFRQASVGYRYEGGRIVRIDNELIHSEVVRPALQFLSDPRFKGPQEEFFAAHAHYRVGEHKDAVADALNAFESTLKTICELKSWEVSKGARASDLIKVVKAKGLLPDYLDTSFDQLIATLQSGLPKVRNEEGGHGQGATPKETPSYVAAYALHLCASKIVLLVEAFKDMK